MKISRRRLLQAAAVATASAFIPRSVYGQSAEFTFKFANNMPVSHPLNVRARQMVDSIRSDTGGRVEIRVFPNNQLGSDTDMLSQLRSGGVEFFTLSGLILSTLVPPAAISGVGFALPDYAAVWKAMDGDLGRHIRGEITKRNLIVMDRIWDNGFRQITSSTKPITTPDDLRGLKIRVPVAPLWTSLFKALGAAPASINFAETYSALQTKVVDGQENPLAIVATAKLYEVQKFCSLTNHMWDGFWFLANKRAWDRLPPPLREIVARNINATALAQRADVAALNGSAQEELQAKGLVFNQPSLDPFRAKLREAGFYAEWKRKFGDETWRALENFSGPLA
jgi:TRAP-type transport system periplasmic protein